MQPTQHYDILVAGGGFAGTCAAIAAGRRGKKVLLIEKYNCLGGAAVYDLVNPFMPTSARIPAGTGEYRSLARGLFTEIRQALHDEDALMDNWAVFNEEVLKYILQTMAIKAGVTLAFQTYITGVRREGKKLTGVTVSTVAGPREYTADCLIDATGDGNLSYLAECPYRLGRPEDSLCQPMTLTFRVCGIEGGKTASIYKRLNEVYKAHKAAGKIQNPREDVLAFESILPDVIHFNTTRVIGLDPTDPDDLTRAEILGREYVMELYRLFKATIPEFENAQLLATGIQIGVRESRMIDCDHLLTEEEIRACTKFEDGIAACNYEIDIHSPTDGTTSHYYFPEDTYYTIPYRSLTPQRTQNLLVAGRCIGASHEAQASLRIMPVCCCLGEAAGVAAALAVEAGGDVRAIDTETLRAILRENGAIVD